MTTTRTAETAARLALVRKQKAPTHRAKYTAQAILELPTQAEVDDFTRQLRINAGVQDVALLPETTWTIVRTFPGRTPVETGRANTAALLSVLAASTSVSIDWPSVTFHWGVAVRYEQDGEAFIARSSDWQLTETYMSS
jgi:hypothetical protein